MLINECSFKTIVLIGDLFVFGNWTYDNYEGEDIIQELDQNNQIVATYTHGPGIDEPISVEKNGQKYYYVSDGLGSITAIVDQNGNIAQSYRYDSFGNILSTTGSLNQPYTYTGREYDPETGLFYYRARYYDANTGRFLQEDPLWLAEGNNLYSYVGNNPVNSIDPSGLLTLPIPFTNIWIPAGEEAGEQAGTYWADRLVNSHNFSDTALSGTMLFFSSLWTCETSDATFLTLATAYAFSGGGPKGGWRRWIRESDPPHHGMGPHDHFFGRRFTTGGPKVPGWGQKGATWKGWIDWLRKGGGWKR